MKIVDLINPAFNVLIERVSKESLSVTSALKLHKMLEQINSAYSEYESKREALLKKYGDKNADGDLILNDNNVVKFSDENLSKFIEEVESISTQSVDINKLNIDDIPQDVRFTQEEIKLLMLILDVQPN